MTPLNMTFWKKVGTYTHKENRCDCQGLGREEGLRKLPMAYFKVMKWSIWYCGGGYRVLYICQNLENFMCFLVAQWLRICLQCCRGGFDPWLGKIPWRRAQAAHSSVFARGIQARVRHNWSDWAHTHTELYTAKHKLDWIQIQASPKGVEGK